MNLLNFKLNKPLSIGLLLIAVLLLQGCKKDIEADAGTDAAVFGVTALVDGTPVLLSAGENDVYMFTEYSYSPQDSLYTFTGRLEKAGCNKCGESIEISIADAEKTLPGQPSSILNVLNKQNLLYKDLTAIASKQYTLTFVAEDSGYLNPTFLWDFGGGKSADSNQKIATATFSDSSLRTVCLTITDLGSFCTKTICNTIKPFNTDKGDSNIVGFNYYVLKTVNFVNTSYGHTFFWDFGDGNTSNAYSPEHLYNAPGTYRVCLTSVVSGIVRTLCKNVVFKDAAFTCLANYSYKSPEVFITLPSYAATVRIKYRDSSGEEYESDRQAQQPGAAFKIVSHSNYELNEKGQKTRLLKLNLVCTVYSTTTSKAKTISIAGGVIAIAYP